jgi:hypothetical protein
MTHSMNPLFHRLLLGALFVLAGQAGQAASPPAERFTVAYRLGFNLSADFQDNAGFASAAAIGPATGGGLNRTYDDGFNQVDITGNAGGQTWNWGYNDASQLPDNDTVVMSSSVIDPAAPINGAKDDPHHGFELGYSRHCGHIGPVRWGLEAAAGWMSVNLGDARALTATTTRTVDAYPLGGIIAPVAPYAGTFAGPGPLIGDSPTRTVTPGLATIAGQREVEAQLFSVRLGPMLEIPLTAGLTFNLGGGFAFTYVDGEFSYQETATVPGASPRFRSGSDSRTDALVGGYLSGGLAWQLSPQWSAFAGAQFVHTGNARFTAGDRSATLRLGSSVFVTAGLGFSF